MEQPCVGGRAGTLRGALERRNGDLRQPRSRKSRTELGDGWWTCPRLNSLCCHAVIVAAIVRVVAPT